MVGMPPATMTVVNMSAVGSWQQQWQLSTCQDMSLKCNVANDARAKEYTKEQVLYNNIAF